MRAAAIQALGKCGDGDAAIPLLHLLLAEEDSSLLDAALEALGGIGDARILDLLELFEPRRLRRRIRSRLK